MNPLKTIIRRAIAMKRALHNLARRKVAQLKRRKAGMTPVRRYNYAKGGYYTKPSLQDQHREACITAYAAKKTLVKEKRGNNTLAGIPAGR